MKFVTDWKEAHTWLSVHVAAIIGVLNAAQATIPHLQGLLTPTQSAELNAVLAVALIWARLVRQGE